MQARARRPCGAHAQAHATLPQDRACASARPSIRPSSRASGCLQIWCGPDAPRRVHGLPLPGRARRAEECPPDSRPRRPADRADEPAITTLRATITKLGGPITIRPRSQPRRGTLSADHRHGVTVPTRPLPRQSASVVDDRVATRREIIVGSVLILIRASLIALARRLIVIRPRLILITRGLVVITRPLVAISQRAVTDLIILRPTLLVHARSEI